jgi:hypothetical protein
VRRVAEPFASMLCRLAEAASACGMSEEEVEQALHAEIEALRERLKATFVPTVADKIVAALVAAYRSHAEPPSRAMQ